MCGRHLDGHHTVYYQESNGRTRRGRERSGTIIRELLESIKVQPTARRLSYSKYAVSLTCNCSGKNRKPRAIFQIQRRTSYETPSATQECDTQYRRPLPKVPQGQQENMVSEDQAIQHDEKSGQDVRKDQPKDNSNERLV